MTNALFLDCKPVYFAKTWPTPFSCKAVSEVTILSPPLLPSFFIVCFLRMPLLVARLDRWSQDRLAVAATATPPAPASTPPPPAPTPAPTPALTPTPTTAPTTPPAVAPPSTVAAVLPTAAGVATDAPANGDGAVSLEEAAKRRKM